MEVFPGGGNTTFAWRQNAASGSWTAASGRVREERRLIAAALGGQVRIVDWQQANSSLFSAVEIERNLAGEPAGLARRRARNRSNSAR